MFTKQIIRFFAFVMISLSISKGVSADSIPWDDIPDVLKDVICATNPGHPDCLKKCPPYCLNQDDRNLVVLRTALEPKLRDTGITFEKLRNGASFANRSGKKVSYSCKKEQLPKRMKGKTESTHIAECSGKVENREFRWRVTVPLDKKHSRNGAKQFRRFIVAASRTYQDDLASLRDQNQQAMAPAHDYLFCAFMTAAGTVETGTPFGGALTGGICLWFLSNGLD